YYPYHCEIKTRPYDGVSDMIRLLRENGIMTAVVSNKMDKSVQALCVKHFDGLVDVAAGENEPHVKRKPAPDMTKKVMQELGVTPEEAVYIGDSEIDMQTAENSGLKCISVAWGFRTREFLEEHGASMIIDSVDELPDAIMRTNYEG
ncbi:MAG: HAD family hydrolase, partial [Oscillospiraceae bacterium]|nr:HAD family hydrolase [Oscillospiraceae bacterium]